MNTPNKEYLIKERNRIKNMIDNYEELDCDSENPEYVARGNGFCDSKYSEEFIQIQLNKLHEQLDAIEKQIKTIVQD